jgi:hypothetical protein
MTWQEAVQILGPERVAQIAARPRPPLRPEQVERVAALLTGEHIHIPRATRVDAA